MRADLCNMEPVMAKPHNGCIGKGYADVRGIAVSPEALVFLGEANQVDLPGAEGDLGVLAGHAPIVTALRPGIVGVIANGRDEKFVILGGIAEFSQSTLNILADTATPIAEFDAADLKARIEEMEQSVSTRPVSEMSWIVRPERLITTGRYTSTSR